MNLEPRRANAPCPGATAARARLLLCLMLALLATLAGPAAAQGRQDRQGIALYWGLVPEAVVSQQHALADLHGGRPRGGGQVHHLVVALFDAASGRRIEDAAVRAQLSEIGVADEPPKYLTPMTVNDQLTYGQMFTTAKEGPYRLRIFVKLAAGRDEIAYDISAPSPHVPAR